jgi:hypothetical protein
MVDSSDTFDSGVIDRSGGDEAALFAAELFGVRGDCQVAVLRVAAHAVVRLGVWRFYFILQQYCFWRKEASLSITTRSSGKIRAVDIITLWISTMPHLIQRLKRNNYCNNLVHLVSSDMILVHRV